MKETLQSCTRNGYGLSNENPRSQLIEASENHRKKKVALIHGLRFDINLTPHRLKDVNSSGFSFSFRRIDCLGYIDVKISLLLFNLPGINGSVLKLAVRSSFQVAGQSKNNFFVARDLFGQS